MSYKLLTKAIQDKVDEYVKELEIDVNELNTYHYEPAHDWGFVYYPEPEERYWDESEESEEQYKLFIKMLKDDLVSDYINIEDDMEKMGYDEINENDIYYKATQELTKEVIDYCEKCAQEAHRMIEW